MSSANSGPNHYIRRNHKKSADIILNHICMSVQNQISAAPALYRPHRLPDCTSAFKQICKYLFRRHISVSVRIGQGAVIPSEQISLANVISARSMIIILRVSRISGHIFFRQCDCLTGVITGRGACTGNLASCLRRTMQDYRTLVRTLSQNDPGVTGRIPYVSRIYPVIRCSQFFLIKDIPPAALGILSSYIAGYAHVARTNSGFLMHYLVCGPAHITGTVKPFRYI